MDPCSPDLALVGDLLSIERVAEVGSTNAALLDRSPWPDVAAPSVPAGASSTASSPAAVWLIAGHQTGGRGRRGRRWIGDPRTSLAASLGVLLPPEVEFGAIPLVVGAAVASTLVAFDARPVLKWPNDVCVVDGKGRLAKAGGILCEMRAGGEDDGRLRLVAGCGLNLLPRPADEPLPSAGTGEPAPAPAGHLFDALAPDVRERLEIALGHAVLAAILDAARNGPADGLAAWSAFDVLADQPVRVHSSAGQYDTIARGIDATGRLRVDDPATPGVVRTLLAEEVSIRSTARRVERPAGLDTISP